VLTVCGLAKGGIFSTKVHTKNKCFYEALIASDYCRPSLQTIVNIKFLCHCRVGCVLRFLFFFEALEIFLKQFSFWVGLSVMMQSRCNYGAIDAI